MKYYFIAGEASGDLHASKVIAALKNVDNQADFRFWGGDRMAAEAGSSPRKHYRDLAFMGFAEVIKNLATIRKNFSFCEADILEFKPDALVLVDYPGFNLRIAEFAKKHRIRTFYYISPQLWAWKKGRYTKIRDFVERLYCILPFEKPFYKGLGIEVDYFGHPLKDEFEGKSFDTLFHEPVLALLPGSRLQEISRMLPLMRELKQHFPNHKLVVAAVNSISDENYNRVLSGTSVSWVKGKTYELLKSAEAAVVTSGTATLETALLGCPQVVVYKTSPISFQLGKWLVKIPYISLVNLILDKPLVKELLQNEATPENVSREVERICKGGDRRAQIIQGYAELSESLGSSGCSVRVANDIFNRLKN